MYITDLRQSQQDKDKKEEQMKLIIDGKQKKVELSDKSKFNSVIEKLKELIVPGKHIIQSITVDGVLLNKKTAPALDKKKIADIKEVIVKTGSTIALAKATLKNADDYLKKFIPGLKKFSDSLQSGGQSEDFDSFIAYIKGWISVVQLIETVRQLLGVNFHKTKIKGKTISTINSELQKVLKQILDAFQNQDMVYLQDLLRYELIPNIEKMRLVIDLLEKTAKKLNK